MGNWRFGAFPKLPYSTMQQLNLDWILDRIRRFLPDNGTKGQVLTRTKDGAAWVDPAAASGAVSSVNGKTGAVVLTASDVGALPESYVPPAAPVQSVNGQKGAVVLTASDVGALPESYVPPAAPVQSVNGQKGAVQLAIPDSTSDLTNDSGFITAAQSAATAPVQSVNGQTGYVSVYVPTFHILRYKFTNLAQYTDNVYYISIPNAMDIAGVPADATVIGMLPEGWSGLGQTFSLSKNGSRGIFVLHQPNFNITSSAYITVYFYYYT